MSRGFSVTPKLNCPHIAACLPEEIGAFQFPNSCGVCGSTAENWVCLTCGHYGCSRYVCGHAADHSQLCPGHNIAISFSDCSAWCYACSDYIDGHSIRPFIRAVQTAKFDHPTTTTQTATPAPAPAPAAAAASSAVDEAHAITQTGSEIDIKDAEDSDHPSFVRCRGCRVKVGGSGLGGLTIKGSSKLAISVSAPLRVGSIVRIMDSNDITLVISKNCGHVFVERSNNVTLTMPGGWQVVHSLKCTKLSISLENGLVYRVKSSSDRPIASQVVKGTIVSEYADGGKSNGDKDDEESESIGEDDGDIEEAPIVIPSNRPKLGHANEEDLKEFFDSPAKLELSVTQLAELIRQNTGKIVIYTGAGVSTSSGIPDYRGPTNGVWTLRDKGINAKLDVTFEEVMPTPTHMAITELVERGIVSFVTSTNVDSLHMASGLPVSKLAELHGNAFLEKCNTCHAPFLRPFDVCTHKGPNVIPSEIHSTGRKCDRCGYGNLMDSIIHFGENLPPDEISRALEESKRADLAIVLGTSMLVHPACDLPGNAKKMVIVNLQRTPFDGDAVLRIFAKTDIVISMLMNKLGITIPPTRRVTPVSK